MLKRYIKITNEDYGESYIETLEKAKDAIEGELSEIEVGGKFVIECIEMEEKEFNDLPEFAGW
jgi:hypothetical protein